MVEIENLSLSYGQNKKVLKNISLNIKILSMDWL